MFVELVKVAKGCLHKPINGLDIEYFHHLPFILMKLKLHKARGQMDQLFENSFLLHFSRFTSELR